MDRIENGITINVTKFVELINEGIGANRNNLKQQAKAMSRRLVDNLQFLDPQMFVITEADRPENQDLEVRNEESVLIFSLENYKMFRRMSEDDYHLDIRPGLAELNDYEIMRNHVRALIIVDGGDDRELREDLVNMYDELTLKLVHLKYVESRVTANEH